MLGQRWLSTRSIAASTSLLRRKALTRKVRARQPGTSPRPDISSSSFPAAPGSATCA
uniref:Uncharacterized protein n=1 Tax=Arundo donax TaxID=35708 RepID=A0A0A9HC81_ARUDO